MSKRQQRNQPRGGKKPPESVFKEAWQNMNEDFARVMPGFFGKRLQGSRGKLWLIVAVTLVELVVLGVVGKLVYDWFTGS